MRNSKGKEVKNRKIIQVVNEVTAQSGMTIHWKKVKGHSNEGSSDSTGNNQAEKLAKFAVDGIDTWSLEAFLEDEPEIVVQIEQVVNVCQVQGTQKPEVCDFYPTEPDSDLVEAQHCQDDQIFG